MNAGPLMLPAAPAIPLVRLWDHDWNVCHVLGMDNVTESDTGDDEMYLVLPVEHVVCSWIAKAAADMHNIYMTIERRTGRRWCGRLRAWETTTAGSCPQCQHCGQVMMRSAWRNEDGLIRSLLISPPWDQDAEGES